MTVTNRTPRKSHSVRQLEARSRARCRKVRVHVVEAERCYYTHSQSEAGTVYHQFRTRDGWQCECPGYLYTGICKHLGQLERRSEREGWTFGKIARPIDCTGSSVEELAPPTPPDEITAQLIAHMRRYRR